VQAYLQADDDDEIEAVIVEHDALLTDAADQALERLLQSARTDGDEEFAQFVKQRHAFLRQVREAISE
jgi:GR25 family glycosyltransferase involved in LPS biosynthesis